MLIPIYLPSKIDAFNLKDEQLTDLSKTFSNVEFINCKSEEQYIDLLSACSLTITWKFKKEWYNKSPNLKYIFTPAAGHDWIDSDPNKNVQISFGTFHGKLMGESLLGMILYMNRNFGELLSSKAKKEWSRNLQSCLPPLSGQTILIVGFGNIAKEFCKLIKPFNCKIIGLQRSFSNKLDDSTGAYLIKEDSLFKYLPKADHIISILPANDETDNLFKIEHFKSMKKTAFFYNIGRGNCVDDELINEMVNDKIIAGAALDVFNQEPLPQSSPLWTNSKIFISPHSSAIFDNYLNLYIEEITSKLLQIIK